MSSDIFVTVNRAKAPVAGIPAIPVQIDTMSQQEAAYYGGAAPYFRYNIFTHALYDIRYEDLLIDTVNIDPKTSTFKQYRVINDPESFFDQHMEIVADRIVGT